MNSRKNKTILATVTSIAIIFAIGNGCRERFDFISHGISTTDKNTTGESKSAKIQEYRSFTQNGLKGLIDAQENILIPAKYDKINFINLQQNYAVATREDLQGLIDLENNILLPFDYEEISPVEPNLDGIRVEKHLHGKLGLNDSNDDTSLIPQKYDRISYVNLEQGYAIVSKDRQTGVYDLKRGRFTPIKYDEIELISSDEYTRYVSSKPKANLKVVEDKAIVLVNEEHKTRLLLQGFSSTKSKYLMVTKDNKKGTLDIDNRQPVIPIEYDTIELNPNTTKHALATKAGKSGILSTHNGETIIPLEYDTIEWNPNTTDYAIVTKAGKSGVLSTHNGKTIIPIEYDKIEWNSNTTDYAIATKENQPGILNIKHNKFIPVESDELDDSLLHQGYAVFTQQNREGIVNLQGKVVIPAQFDSIEGYLIEDKYLTSTQNQRMGLLNLETKKFRAFNDEKIDTMIDENLFTIKSGGSNVESGYLIIYNNDDEGVIDLQGNIIVPLVEYGTIEGYRDGVVLIRSKIIPGEFGDAFNEFITNKPIIPSKTEDKAENNKETNDDSRDLFIDDVAVLMVQSGKYFCGIDRQGKLLFKAQSGRWSEGEKIDYLCRSLVGIKVNNNSVNRDSRHRDYEGFVREGFIQIYVNGKYGYANAKGEVVIYPQFDRAYNFVNGLAQVGKDYKWGLVDRTGKIILEPQFDNIKNFEEGLAVVKQDDKYGYIDRTGKIVIKPQFDSATDFKEGLAVVKQDDKYGYIDRTGKIVIKPQFDDAGYFDKSIATVRKNGIEFIIDPKGNFIFNLQSLKNIFSSIMKSIAG